jgi:alpha-mannosidase
VEGPENFIIETVKGAEDGRGLIIRGYECNRQRGEISLRVNLPLAHAEITTLLEEPLRPVTWTGSEIRFPLKPFEIITLRVVPL